MSDGGVAGGSSGSKPTLKHLPPVPLMTLAGVDQMAAVGSRDASVKFASGSFPMTSFCFTPRQYSISSSLFP